MGVLAWAVLATYGRAEAAAEGATTVAPEVRLDSALSWGGTLGGGGGGSLYIGGPGVSSASTLSGSDGTNSGVLPANTSDPNYQSGIGNGGAYAGVGGNGLAVLSFTAVPEPSTWVMILGVSLIFGVYKKTMQHFGALVPAA